MAPTNKMTNTRTLTLLDIGIHQTSSGPGYNWLPVIDQRHLRQFKTEERDWERRENADQILCERETEMGLSPAPPPLPRPLPELSLGRGSSPLSSRQPGAGLFPAPVYMDSEKSQGILDTHICEYTH